MRSTPGWSCRRISTAQEVPLDPRDSWRADSAYGPPSRPTISSTRPPASRALHQPTRLARATAQEFADQIDKTTRATTTTT